PPQGASPISFWRLLLLREGLRVLLDQLLDVALKPHQHLLLDGHVEVDLDRLVGGLDRDAARQRQRDERGCCGVDDLSGHGHLSVGGVGVTVSLTGVCDWFSCSSSRRTSVTIPGTSESGRGSTVSICWRGSR